MQEYYMHKNGELVGQNDDKNKSCGGPQVSAAVSAIFSSSALRSAKSAAPAALARGTRVRIVSLDDVVGTETCFGHVIEQCADGRFSINLDSGQLVNVKLENMKVCLFQ